MTDSDQAAVYLLFGYELSERPQLGQVALCKAVGKK